jgi:serine/threonine-protein kinase
LQHSLEALLDSAGRSLPGLKESVAAVAEDVLEPQQPRIGERIGPYELIRMLGAGGMGVVYLARRAGADFEQLAAIKLLRAGFYAREVVLRFRSERQILANLSHPNIARLLDGGLTANGQPYLVMEYVDGLPLLEYCRNHGLSTRQRLELFIQVCAGVQSAHQNLVVHRDIKPENILVAADGIPKLLDFGIAKLLAPEMAQHTLAVTTDTHRLMTPEYASPEQVRGEVITTATDIYSLGVVLYELATERKPFSLFSKSPGEIERVICEADPPSPGVDGELDTIIFKSMHKDAARRYASVGELADDIRRYLSGYPLVAQRDSWTYRARKFVRRNRWPVSVAGIAAVLILSFGAGMAVLAGRARVERDRAEQVSRFLVDMFAQADPEVARGNTMTARQILDRGVEQVGTLRQEPEIRVRLLETFGKVYENLGAWERSRDVLQDALRIRRSVHGSASEETAQALKNLAELTRRLRDLSSAEALARESIGIRAKVLGTDHPRYLETLNTLALVLHESGRLREAEKLFLEVIASRARLRSVEHLETAVLSNLGGLYRDLGEAGEAEKYLRECVQIRRQTLGSVHPRLALALMKLAAAVRKQGRLGDAESLAREAVAINEKLFGESSPVVAGPLTGLAEVLSDKGDYRRSERLLERASLIQQTTAGANVRDMEPELVLASVREREGRFAEAETLVRAVLEQRRRVFGEGHVKVARTRIALGRLLLERKRVAEAREQIEPATDLLLAAISRETEEAAGALALKASVAQRD